MAGGAIAAKHYLIESTRQINPKVLRTLHGATGLAAPPAQVDLPEARARRARTAPTAKKGRVAPARDSRRSPTSRS